MLLAIALAVVALYTGFFIFTRIVKDIDAQTELARGNCAIGLLIASIFIGISLTVVSFIKGIINGLSRIFADGALNPLDTLAVFLSCLELILGILLVIGSIYLAIAVFSRLNSQTNLIKAMKDGNVAIACVVAGMITTVSVIIHYGVLGIVTALF
ncbi:MAG: DUF350 domain-containing protein [Methanomicrobiales archaeon]